MYTLVGDMLASHCCPRHLSIYWCGWAGGFVDNQGRLSGGGLLVKRLPLVEGRKVYEVNDATPKEIEAPINVLGHDVAHHTLKALRRDFRRSSNDKN